LLGVISSSGNNPGKFPAVVLNNLWAVLFLLPVNYIFFEYSLPYILKKRTSFIYNVLTAILLLWIHLMIYSFASYLWRQFGIQLNIFTALKTFSSVGEALENQMAYSTGSIFLFGIARHAYNYQHLKQASQQLKIEKQEAELNYLKSQTNPHFLFNTLNNIYVLSREKSELAPESILRLSKILRYMLYETSGAFIAIEQELKILNDYIALEKLRYDDSLSINFNYDVEDLKQSLPPLLLMPLVENAFKHGVSETTGRPFVDIHLSVQQRQLVFVVKNSAEMGSASQGIKENIGLSNLRRQLELLYKEFDLAVSPGTTHFTATLKINLASHV
jgi:two-component system, LytTR family, sensor kinase